MTGPSRATDTFFNDKIQYGYYGEDFGGTGSADVSPPRKQDDPVTEDDFEKGRAGQRRVGSKGGGSGRAHDSARQLGAVLATEVVCARRWRLVVVETLMG